MISGLRSVSTAVACGARVREVSCLVHILVTVTASRGCRAFHLRAPSSAPPARPTPTARGRSTRARRARPTGPQRLRQRQRKRRPCGCPRQLRARGAETQIRAPVCAGDCRKNRSSASRTSTIVQPVNLRKFFTQSVMSATLPAIVSVPATTALPAAARCRQCAHVGAAARTRHCERLVANLVGARRQAKCHDSVRDEAQPARVGVERDLHRRLRSAVRGAARADRQSGKMRRQPPRRDPPETSGCRPQ
jgi:hypothetical protein